MKSRILAAIVLATALSGGAYAQTTSSPGPSSDNPNRDEASGILTDPELMVSFYTDDTMTTLRSEEELRVAFGELTPENQAAMRTECEEQITGEPNVADDSQAAKDLCMQIQQF